MKQLINKVDIQELIQLTNSDFNTNSIKESILNSQIMDLEPLLTDELYNNLLMNVTDDNYQTLLKGGIYNFEGTAYTNVGLKTVLSYYAYARFILFGDVKSTPFGNVIKDSNFSENENEASKKKRYKMYQQVAFKYWRNVELFLNRNATNYPLWNNKSLCQVNKNRVFRISKIS